MIAKIRLTRVSSHIVTIVCGVCVCVCVLKTLKIHSLSSFQIRNTGFETMVAMVVHYIPRSVCVFSVMICKGPSI